MNHLRLAVAVSVSIAALTGCELKLQWHDATQQHRGDEQLQNDATLCATETGIDPKVGADDAHEKAWENCLRGKGWAPNGTTP